MLLAVHFNSPSKARAEERSVVEFQRRVVINLCKANVSLADKLNQWLDNEQNNEGIITVFFDRNGRYIEIVPTSSFSLMVKFLAERSRNIKYDEIISELLRHDSLLRGALRNSNNRKFMAERIK